MACAISIASNEVGKLYRIENVFDRVSSSIAEATIQSLKPIELHAPTWQLILEDRLRSTEAVKHFVAEFNNWLSKIHTSPYITARWMCHGHIGIALISKVYSACVAQFDASAPGEQRQLLNGFNDAKFAVLASFWARLAITNGIDHPSELFELLSAG